MKPLISAATLLLALSLTANAQTGKVRWVVGVQAGNLTASAGYFVANGLAMGLSVPLSLRTSSNGLSSSKTTSVGGSPFVTYFIGSAKLKPFVGFSYGYSQTAFRSDLATSATVIYEQTSNGHSHSYVSSLGLAYKVSRNVALTLSARYLIIRSKQAYIYTDAHSVRASTTNSANRS